MISSNSGKRSNDFLEKINFPSFSTSYTPPPAGINESFFIENKKLYSSEEVQGITISKILLENNFDNIDILKLDIEGAEKYLFAKTIKW